MPSQAEFDRIVGNSPDDVLAEMRRALRTPMRREIARACAEQPRSVGDVAALLGKPDGAIRGTFTTLVEEGVLVTRPLPGRRAQGFLLAETYRPILDEIAISAESIGRLTESGRLLIVAADNLRGLLQALSDVAEHDHFVWAARLSGAARVALFFKEEGVLVADQLQVRLEGQNFRVTAEQVERRMSARELREWAAEVLDAGSLEGVGT